MKTNNENDLKLKVTDLKQFLYCRRIVFYNHVLPIPKRSTYKMRHGKIRQNEIEVLEKRRLLAEYGLKQGKRYFNVPLYSSGFGLSGVVDLLIENDESIFPIDFKETEYEPGQHHELQLTAYALLAEDKFHKPALKGFIYTMENDDIFEIKIDEFQRARFFGVIKEIKELITSEKMPETADNINKCVSCEFKNFCRDVF